MKYTFIMPVYNSSSSLRKSVESVINQNYLDWELIAVDDGSTDDSFIVLKNYSKKDARIKSYTKSNSGPGDTRNFAIQKATGDYIAFLDSDDYYEFDFLDKINEIANKDKCDVIFVSTINEQTNGKIDYCDNLYKYRKRSKNDLIGFQMAGKLPWGPCSKVVKSDIVKKCSFSKIAVGEEAIYSFEVLRNANKICFLEKPMYHYVHNENGQHKKGGIDPWYPVVAFMKEHLTKTDSIKEFEGAFASLAINAMIISMYRISISNNFKESYDKIQEQLHKYKKEYNLDRFEKKYLNFKSKMIYFLIKVHLISIVILSSKLRKKYLSKNGE